MRLIDADKLEVVGISVPDGMDADSFAAGAQAVLERLDKAPTVDAVPIANVLDSKDLIRRKDVLWITKETGAMETQSRVRELPAIDAVPVTHCRDCEFAKIEEGFPRLRCCAIYNAAFPANGFCNLGVKKKR
jgi:hypothetical protein